jgi:PBP1b-binding outer membrane lipoprotein LpoB
MKRLLILWITAVFLAACAAAEPETPVTAVPQAATAVQETAAPVEEDDASAVTTLPEPVNIAGFPAANVDEANIVRERDWKIGAEDPLVTIIEYGDFQ